MQRKEQGI